MCRICNGINKHTTDCTFQDKNTLICDGKWVNTNKAKLGLQKYSNNDGVIEYKSLPSNSINQSKTSPKVFQRIELTIEENGNYYYFHVYDNDRLRFVHVPIEVNWREKARYFIHYLNVCGQDILLESIPFEERYSFISQVTEKSIIEGDISCICLRSKPKILPVNMMFSRPVKSRLNPVPTPASKVILPRVLTVPSSGA